MKTPGKPKRNPILDEAHALYQNGNIDEAAEKLRQMPKQARAEIPYRTLLGTILAQLGRNDEALDIFTKVLKDDPKCFEALIWLAVHHRETQSMGKAIDFARRATAAHPADSTGWGTLGTCLLAAKRPDDSLKAFETALRLDPQAAEHHHNIAQAYFMLDRRREAIPELHRAIELSPNVAKYYLSLATIYSVHGMVGDAQDWLNKALSRFPHDPHLHTTTANCYALMRNNEKAESHYKQAIAITSDARISYGTWLVNQGRFSEANKIFEKMIAEGGDPCFAFYNLMQGRKLKNEPEDLEFLENMEATAAQSDLRLRSEMYLYYALGKAYEQLKRFEKAMTSFDRANDLANQFFRSSATVPVSSFAEDHKKHREVYEKLKALNLPGHESDKPIFIIGMIRSGTTLLDQILSSHPAVRSGGEIQFWIEESKRLMQKPLAPDALQELSEDYINYAQLFAGTSERFTDKMPLNYACAGAIHLAMPNARFVHIRRNPVDTCLSIWTTFFGHGPIFAFNKENIVASYREYLGMMDWLRDRLPPSRFYEIDYEDLISEPERVIRGVIEFLDLPWDEACLRHDQNTMTINTPSHWQARQPIYKSSIERWRAYEPWLGEFGQLIGI